MPKAKRKKTPCAICVHDKRPCHPYPGGNGCQACFLRSKECTLLPIERATQQQTVRGALRSFLKLYGCSAGIASNIVMLRLDAYELFEMVMWQHSSILQFGILSEIPYGELLRDWAKCFPVTLRHAGLHGKLHVKLRLSRRVLEWPVTRALMRNPRHTISVVLDLTD